MPSEPKELTFPLKGIDEGRAYSRQPEGTTPDARNVRPFDTLNNRLRGGQRPGLTKFIADAVNSPKAIQEMDQVTLALDPSTVNVDTALIEEDFTSYGTDDYLRTHDAVNWPECFFNDGGDGSNDIKVLPIRDAATATEGNKVTAADDAISDGDGGRVSTITKSLVLGEAYVVEMGITLGTYSGTGNWNLPRMFGILFRCDTANKECTWVEVRSTSATTANIYAFRQTSDDNVVSIWTENVFSLAGGHDWEDDIEFKITVSGNIFLVYLDGQYVNQFTDTTNTSDTKIGLMTGYSRVSGSPRNFPWPVDTDSLVKYFNIYTGIASQSLRQTKLVVVSGGSVYTGNQDGVLLAGAGSGVLSATRWVSHVGLSQKSFIVDGFFANYTVVDHLTNQVSTWTPTAGQLPGGGTGTSYAISSVDTTTNRIIAAAGTSDAFDANDIIEWFDCIDPKNNMTYKVTADNTGNDLTLQETINSDPGGNYGSIRASGVGCRYGALYRGRVVLWGMHTAPHNWYMSAVNDPLNWDYFPSVTSAIQAVAGNNSDAGELGDILICCAPYSDDIMIMGGDHTLSVMRGDPADRGRIDNISYQTGIVGPRAFTWDTQNNFYFLGAGQLWRMNAGDVQPESISRNRLDAILGAIDLTDQEVKLAWDRDNQGLHIFIVPSSQPSTAPVHIYWDQRSDSFWQDQFPAAMGPTVAFSFDADDPDDRALLFGGWDSYIRFVDTSIKNDDGTAISSYVYYSPVNPGRSIQNTKVSRIVAVMDTSSDDATLQVYAEDSVQAAVDSSTVRYAATLSGGRNTFIPRIAGNTMVFKVSDATAGKAWAMENLVINVEAMGHTRKKQL